MRALSSGMPAATSEPKVTSNTTAAKRSPKTSVMVMPKVLSENTCPPKATVIPACSPMDAVSLSCVIVAAVTSVEAPVNWIWVRAIRSSVVIELPAYSENGLTTESTPPIFPIAASIFSIAAL